MKVFDYVKKRFLGDEKKSISAPRQIQDLIGYGYGLKNKWSWLSFTKAWDYYQSISVIADAVDRSSQEISNINPVLRNKKTGEILDSYNPKQPITEILQLLKNPSHNQGWQEFSTAWATSFLVTGNSFVILSIGSSKKPLEIIYVNPQDITIEAQSESNVRVDYESSTQKLSFTLKDGGYYSQNGDFQLKHTRKFNPKYNIADNPMGLSPLSSLFYEIEHHIKGNMHNSALLDNGARPSGALMLDPDAELPDEQYQRLKTEIRAYYQGSGNTGNVMVLEGAKSFQELSVSNKDMDFAKLNEISKSQIYSNMKIPKPMVSEKTMSYSNFNDSLFQMYYLNVLPNTKRMLDEMGELLLPKYKGGDDYEIVYDVSKIPALRSATIEQLDVLTKTGLITINEGRNLMSFENVKNGDFIYKPANMLPIGKTVENEESKKYFENKLKELGYNEAEIKNMWENNGKNL